MRSQAHEETQPRLDAIRAHAFPTTSNAHASPSAQSPSDTEVQHDEQRSQWSPLLTTLWFGCGIVQCERAGRMQRKDIALKQQWTNVQRIDCRRMGIRRLHSSAEHRAIPAPGYHDDTASENEIERPNKSHEENEEEDTLTSGTQIDDSKTRQSRSRNETYRRRLKLDSVDILEVIDRKKSVMQLSQWSSASFSFGHHREMKLILAKIREFPK